MSTSLLPPNAQPAETAVDRSAAVRLEALPLALTALWSADLCPEEFLPFLAHALSVDVWRVHWPIEVKRRVLADSWKVHTAKGTRAGVRRALATLDVATVISEWFETDGEPYTFRIRALAGSALDPNSDAIVGPEFEDVVRRIVTAVKPVRAHFELEVGARATFRLGMASAAQCIARTEPVVEIGQGEIRLESERVGVATSATTRQTTTILAEIAA